MTSAAKSIPAGHDNRVFSRVGLVAKSGQSSIVEEINHIASWLEEHGLEVVFDEAAGELAHGESSRGRRWGAFVASPSVRIRCRCSRLPSIAIVSMRWFLG